MEYLRHAENVVAQSSIAVMVLLNADNSDMEFWRLRPSVPEGALTPAVEFVARKLRPVGVVGLSGSTPLVAFKEPLSPPVVQAIAFAFLEYLRVLIGQSFAEQTQSQQKGDEVEWLWRLRSLPDTRMN